MLVLDWLAQCRLILGCVPRAEFFLWASKELACVVMVD